MFVCCFMYYNWYVLYEYDDYKENCPDDYWRVTLR